MNFKSKITRGKTGRFFIFVVSVCLLLLACYCYPAKVNASGENPATILDGYTIKTDETNGGYRYINYIKTENNVQTQSFFYGETNLKEKKNVRLVEYSNMNDDGTFKLTNVMNLAKDYEKETNNKVLVAVNGTFYNPMKPTEQDPLLPWFSFVKNQELIKQGMHLEGWMVPDNGIGWNKDGVVATGGISTRSVGLQTDDGQKKTVYEVKYNEKPEPNEIAVFDTGKFSVRSKFNAYKVVVTKTMDRAAYDSGYNKSYFTSKFGTNLTKCAEETITVKDNEFYIEVGANSEAEKAITAVKGSFNLIPIAGGAFRGIEYFCGANHTLVKDGKTVEAYPGSSHETSFAPRTTLGFKEDGTAFLFVADGRQAGYANGLQIAPKQGSVKQYSTQGEIAKQLNATTAVEFDGGGSSTFIIRKNDALTVVNKPSDGNLRGVLNAVMLVEVKDEPQIVDPVPVPPTTTGCNKASVTIALALSGLMALFVVGIKI